jgi:arabinose-5-phosphate isomerase
VEIEMTDGGTRLERMRATLRREASVLESIAADLDESAPAAVDMLLDTRGHVLIGGAGTSNAIAWRFAHLLSCCGVPALFLDPAEAVHGGAGAVKPGDTVVLVSREGLSSEVNAYAAIAKQRGAKVIAVTAAPESELGRLADAAVRLRIRPGSDPFDMIATASSLASGAAADAICETILFERNYTKEAFAATHPAGGVGERMRREQLAGADDAHANR